MAWVSLFTYVLTGNAAAAAADLIVLTPFLWPSWDPGRQLSVEKSGKRGPKRHKIPVAGPSGRGRSRHTHLRYLLHIISCTILLELDFYLDDHEGSDHATFQPHICWVATYQNPNTGPWFTIAHPPANNSPAVQGDPVLTLISQGGDSSIVA